MERPPSEKTIEQVVNGFRIEESIKKLLLEVAQEKDATPEDMEDVIRMMSTETLPDNSFPPDPLVQQVIDSVSERARDVYGSLRLRLMLNKKN
jgi:hypothetical protein